MHEPITHQTQRTTTATRQATASRDPKGQMPAPLSRPSEHARERGSRASHHPPTTNTSPRPPRQDGAHRDRDPGKAPTGGHQQRAHGGKGDAGVAGCGAAQHVPPAHIAHGPRDCSKGRSPMHPGASKRATSHCCHAACPDKVPLIVVHQNHTYLCIVCQAVPVSER